MNKNNEDNSAELYVSSFSRSMAAAIDMIIVLFLRSATAQILWDLWVRNRYLDFITDFKQRFGIDVMGRNPEQMAFLAQHPMFKTMLLFYLIIIMVGACYHALLNSSFWSATIGKRIMNIALIREEGKRLGVMRAFGHYFLALVPWIFAIYIAAYTRYNGMDFYQSIIHNFGNILFGLIVVFWIYIPIVTKKRTTAQDLICNAVMIKGRFGKGFPRWSFRVKK